MTNPKPVDGVGTTDISSDVRSADASSEAPEPTDDELAALPPERLAAMLREKRKSEAGVRTRLREAEEERDRLSTSVSGFQREAFTVYAKTRRLLPEAISDLHSAIELGAVVDDAGLFDPVKAAGALDELSKAKPHWFVHGGVSGADFSGGHNEDLVRREAASWSAVLSDS